MGKEHPPEPPFPPQRQSPPGRESAMRPRADHGEDSYVGLGRLRGRVALVTGGDSGIGRAVALAFAREGADVAISYLSEHDDAGETQRLVNEAGRASLAIAGDLGEESVCRAIVEHTVEKFGRIDVLVNNAAFQGKAVERFEEIGPDRVDHAFRVNILAMFHVVRHALGHMREGSSIINVSSVQAYHPGPDILDYATTKGAIVTFTKGLALSLVERGIRVNAVAPGPVWTPLVTQSFDPEKTSRFGENYPMKRPAQPVELAPAFVFLASDESRYVTGEVLGVTGGRPLG